MRINICSFFFILLFGCATEKEYPENISNTNCVVDTFIFNNNFSICIENNNDSLKNKTAVIQYKQAKQTIPWASFSDDIQVSKAFSNNLQVSEEFGIGILFLGDTLLKAINSFFYDSIYLITSNDEWGGILYCIKFSTKGDYFLLRNKLLKNYLLQCRYGQFIVDTTHKKVFIANQNIEGYVDGDINEEFSFSEYDFSGNSFKYVGNIENFNTQYISTKEQMLNLQKKIVLASLAKHNL
jgi:hypothetical protein